MAAMRASRALVAVAARSMAHLPDITVPQYRALVVLAQLGTMRAGDLADALGTAAPNLTKLVDRLVEKRLVRRETNPESRREVMVRLSAAGAKVVADVARARAEELDRIIAAMPTAERAALVAAFDSFADAAGERYDREWAVPWL
jgi:DNA-binding MarR family transcriptional regulator